MFMNEKQDRREIPETGGEFGDEDQSFRNTAAVDNYKPYMDSEDMPEETDELQLDENQAHAFEETFEYLDESVSPSERDALQLSVTQIMLEAARGENANEALLWKRMDDLRRTHPQILQKLLDSLNATGTGFHTRVRRVAERMAEQINNPSPDQEAF
jgi:hypothetical protein